MSLTTGRDFGWMKKHCLPEGRRSEVKAPFCIKGTSVAYACASTGRYLIAVTLFPGEPVPFEFAPVDDIVMKVLEGGPAPKYCVSPKDLIDWVKCKNCNGIDIIKTCTGCNGKKTQKCSECGGNGTVGCTCNCGDRHRRECDSCNGKRTEDCSTCDGRGTVGCCCRTDADPARIVDIPSVIDRQFVRAAIADLPLVWGKKILISTNENSGVDPVRFDLDGWSLVIMPTTASPRSGTESLHVEKIEVLDAMAQI
jgi:hypothetical protein